MREEKTAGHMIKVNQLLIYNVEYLRKTKLKHPERISKSVTLSFYLRIETVFTLI